MPVMFDAPLFDALQIFLFLHMNHNSRSDPPNDALIS